MAKTDIKLNGAKLILKEIPVTRVLVRKVLRNNKTSGKITIPHDLIDKEVYVVISK